MPFAAFGQMAWLCRESGRIGFNGSTSWNYQCPKCPVGGGMSMGANVSEKEWNVWCEDVACVPEQCEALYEGNACAV